MSPVRINDVSLDQIVESLSREMPDALRWAGAVAKQLRRFNVALPSKQSGSANTDALTLADLSVQELVVAAMRDRCPVSRQCRLEAEEANGDIAAFATESPYTIALDPIDGTKQYRDKTTNGYAVVLTLRSPETLHYSLVFVPESGSHGTWVEVKGSEVRVGEDDTQVPARAALDKLRPVDRGGSWDAKPIYLIGFQREDTDKARAVTETGLVGVPPDDLPGCIFELIAKGEFGGSLIHSPNVYDFPVSLHIARVLGGDALWVHNRQPVNFSELWMDERASMLRLPGIIACSPNRETLATLCEVAKDWSPIRYRD